MGSTRIPLELPGGARGFRYGELPGEIGERLEEWLERGSVEQGSVLKPDRVWRVGAWAVKLYPRRRGAAGWLGRSAALRAAELARALPIRTPRPLVALEQRRGPRRGAGLLVTDYIEGRWLHILWDDDAAARQAFPEFMAQMHARGVFHGDLNSRNMLWTGTEWVLLDLDGVPRGLRGSLRRRRLVEAQWVRVIATLRGRHRSRELFEAYLEQVGRKDPDGALWKRIETRARETVRRWDEKRAPLPMPPASPAPEPPERSG